MTNSLNGIKKAEKFLWNEEIERDFVELKKAFMEGGIQAYPNFGVGDPFILTTDWSKENIAGVLHRFKAEENGSWDAGEESATNTRRTILATKVNY